MLLLYSKSIKCILTALYCIRVTHTQFYNLHINTCKLQWGLFTFKCRQITNSLVLLIGWAKYQWVIWFVKKWFREIVRIWPAKFLSFYKSLVFSPKSFLFQISLKRSDRMLENHQIAFPQNQISVICPIWTFADYR